MIVAKQVLTHFVLADNMVRSTGQQKGQLVKQIVKSKLDGKHLTSEPVSASVVGGEEHVTTVMRSMRDPETMEVWSRP